MFNYITLFWESIAKAMWSPAHHSDIATVFGTIKLLVKTGEEWGALLKLSPMISELRTPQMPMPSFNFRPMVPSGPMGYDVMRDAQLRYALERDEATTIEPQAKCFGSPGIFPRNTAGNLKLQWKPFNKSHPDHWHGWMFHQKPEMLIYSSRRTDHRPDSPDAAGPVSDPSRAEPLLFACATQLSFGASSGGLLQRAITTWITVLSYRSLSLNGRAPS